MKLLSRFLPFLLVLLAPTLLAQAQAPPGWGWVQHLGTYAPNPNDRNGVAGLGRDAAGNLYLLGSYNGTPALSGTPTTNLGETDIFLAKYSPAGALLWLRTLQSTGGDLAQALVVEPSGRCTLAGLYGAISGGNLTFGSFGGGAELAGAARLGLAASGGYYGALAFVAAVDANGALLWANTPSPVYGGLVTNMRLCRDSGGQCYLAANTNAQGLLVVNGQNYPPVGSTDAVLLKYSPAGQVVSVRRVGVSSGSASTYSGALQVDAADALYWLLGHSGPITIDQLTIPNGAGTGNSLVKISAANRVRWAKPGLLQVANANVVSQLVPVEASNNAVYLMGNSTGGSIAFAGASSPVAVFPNAVTSCIARCDTAGQVQWVKPVWVASNVSGGIPGPRIVGVSGMVIRGSTLLIATSTVPNNQTSYVGLPRNFGLSEAGMPCVVQFNITTNQTDWVRIGGVSPSQSQNTYSEIKAMCADGAGNAYVAGDFIGTAQFGATSIVSATSIQPEMFLAKLDQTIATATAAGGPAQPWGLFPNPSTGTVQLRGLPAAARVSVRDAVGRLIRELPALGTSTGTPERALSGLAPGLYLVQVANTREPYRTQKLLVQ